MTTTDDKSVSDRLYVFAKVLRNNAWTTALLAAYNPDGSTEVSYEAAKAALVTDLTTLSRRSQQEADGWRLVPVAVTDDQLLAMRAAYNKPGHYGQMINVYAAALAAAPQSTEGK